MTRRVVFPTLYVGILLAITGFLAWITGRALIFPSLGPSAFLLAIVSRGEEITTRRVIGGHFIGILAGLLAHHTVAPGLVVTTATPMFAGEQLRLVISGIVSVMLTTGGMLTTETVHPPACATTLIVSLGLLTSVIDGGFIMLGVTVLFGAHRTMIHSQLFDE